MLTNLFEEYKVNKRTREVELVSHGDKYSSYTKLTIRGDKAIITNVIEDTYDASFSTVEMEVSTLMSFFKFLEKVDNGK